MKEQNIDIKTTIEESDYKYGFTSDIETEFIPKGLNEGVIRLISQKKEEPEWLLELRLKAYLTGLPSSTQLGATSIFPRSISTI